MKRIYYIMAALLFCAASINAQVRIGKNDDPHKGAILDLQFAEEAENKGILLPRVKLESLSSFTIADQEDAIEGMLVYNIGSNDVPKGLYVWANSQWLAVGSANGGTDPVDPNLPGTVEDWITVEDETPVTGEGTEENPYINDCSSAETVTLTAKEGYTFGTISPTEAATQGEDGSLTFIASGNVVVTKGSQSGVIHVEVEECEAEEIIDRVEIVSSNRGLIGTHTLSAKVYTETGEAINQSVTWTKVSGNSTASINLNSGVITATSRGNVVVRATSESGISSADYTFTFEETPTSECGAYIDGGEWLAFMCYNLGATENGKPFEYSEAILGDLYQWGRIADGHQIRTSDVVAGPVEDTDLSDNQVSSTASEYYSKFITNGIPNGSDPYDWRATQNTTLWSFATKTAYDPCPAGWKVPSNSQWTAVYNYNKATISYNKGLKIGNSLYLPSAGMRLNATSAAEHNVGSQGRYWSSTIRETRSYNLLFESATYVVHDSSYRSYGMSVRCVADN